MQIKRFQELTLEEKKEVLAWRNDPAIRQYMIHQEKISLEDHLRFIKNLDATKVYLKVDAYGVVNFHIKDGYAEIGLHKNPAKTKVGSLLMRTLLEYGIEKLHIKKFVLYVYKSNETAIALYKRFGFKQTGVEGSLIKMEKDYANS